MRRDWCDGNGHCQHSRKPGCDKPDDNNDYSSFPEYDVLPIDESSKIAVLNNGFADVAIDTLIEAGTSVALADISLVNLNNYDILVVPSGGFSGLETSDNFRERLWAWVEMGVR
jgi:hypothetical protein